MILIRALWFALGVFVGRIVLRRKTLTESEIVKRLRERGVL